MFRLAFNALIVILILGVISCSRNPGPPVLDDEVILNYGQTVTLANSGLKIKFDTLLTDSRCPDNPLIDCFWQGMAAIQLSLITSDNDTIYIVTSIEGLTKYPEQDSYPAVDTLGLSIELIELYPYPGVELPIPLSQYRATLKVKASTDSVNIDGRVLIIDIDPISLLRDDYIIDSAFIEDDILTLKVAYGGGCKTHYFFACVQNAIMESNPPQINLYLHHFGNDDFCMAYIHQNLKFDLTPLAEYYRSLYPEGGDLIIRLNESTDSVPDLKEQITYHIK